MLATFRTISYKRLAAIVLVLVAVFFSGFLSASPKADQPHMQAALDSLNTAKHELEVAKSDKGGHRVKALSLVNDAISQVEQGIEYDRTH